MKQYKYCLYILYFLILVFTSCNTKPNPKNKPSYKVLKTYKTTVIYTYDNTLQANISPPKNVYCIVYQHCLINTNTPKIDSLVFIK